MSGDSLWRKRGKRAAGDDEESEEREREQEGTSPIVPEKVATTLGDDRAIARKKINSREKPVSEPFATLSPYRAL